MANNSGHSTFSRRSIIAGTAGIALGTIPIVQGGPDYTTVPWKTYYGEQLYEDVPTEWKEHYERSRESMIEFSYVYFDEENVLGVGLGSSPDESNLPNGLSEYDISVAVSDTESTDNLPEKYDGLTVKTKDGSHIDRKSDDSNSASRDVDKDSLDCEDNNICYNEVEPDDIRGGYPLWAVNSAHYDDFGTLGTNAYIDGVGGVGVTAHHIVPWEGGGNVSCPYTDGRVDWNQYCRDYGLDYDYDESMDVHIIDFQNTNRTIHNEINEASNGTDNNYTVTGAYSDWAIATMCSNNDTVRKTGMASGTTEGPITDCDFRYMSVCGEDSDHIGVEVEADFAPGDSGAMTYVKTGSYEAHLVSMVQAETDMKIQTEGSCPPDTTGEFIGPAAWAIEDEFDIDWTST